MISSIHKDGNGLDKSGLKPIKPVTQAEGRIHPTSSEPTTGGGEKAELSHKGEKNTFVQGFRLMNRRLLTGWTNLMPPESYIQTIC